MSKTVLSLFALLAIAPMLFSCSSIGNKVAVIPLEGTIQSSSGTSIFGGSSITPESVRKYVDKVKDDVTIKAVVLQIDSPGGDVGACEEIVYELDRINKPLVVSMRSIAASGGYYISAKANKIVALQSTLTGSIGVISMSPNLSGLMDKIGVKMQITKSGKYKDMYSGFTELTPEEKEIFQKTNDQIYEQFIGVVADGRHMDRAKVRELATGQTYSGRDARELGLVDEIGGLQTAIDLAAKLAGVQNPVPEYIYPETPHLLDLLFGAESGQLARVIYGGLSGAESMAASEFFNNPYPRFLYK
jgi:protease IV